MLFPELLSSFEVMDAESVRSVRDNLHLRLPLDGKHPFYLLVEVPATASELEANSAAQEPRIILHRTPLYIVPRNQRTLLECDRSENLDVDLNGIHAVQVELKAENLVKR
ncbi:uncharacterized protein LOC142767776 [Rhipicephalus microplus]|uniref:uncharacterized protein LOC142767776 n=1 Tax=Rhipicephalus microplus TaxID=6941 RepID=UPI003F6D8B77